MKLYLRDDLRAALDAGEFGPATDAFEALAGVTGELYRQAAGRRTLRFVASGGAYFAKLHGGVGWREIAKNLVTLKPPVLGARNEFTACRHLCAHGITAPRVAAFGERGGNPARRRSFVICDALEGFVSLEEVGDRWLAEPPPLAVKRRLLRAVGELTGAMHAAGVNHRDYYICHLLADAARLAEGEVALAVIDLHRAQVRQRTPDRWRRRDLAALLYSTSGLALTRQDRLRFVAAYTGERPAAALRRRRRLWTAVSRRATRLGARAKGPTGFATTAASDVATVARLADLGREPPAPFRFDVAFGAVVIDQPAPPAPGGSGGGMIAAEAGDREQAPPGYPDADGALTGGVRVVCRQVLDIWPGRRLVARAVVNDGTADGAPRELLVKAFMGRRGARHLARERRAMAAFAAAGVATPKLLGVGQGGGARVLAFEYLAGARALVAGDSAPLLATLARLHERGVRQRKPRAGNFLIQGQRLFVVAGYGVRRGRVGRAAGLADIASRLADFPPTPAAALAALGWGYAEARGWPPSAVDGHRLAELVARKRRQRIRKFVAQTVRDGAQFAVGRTARRRLVVARGDDDAKLRAVLADPRRALAGGTVLKSGGGKTVARAGNLIIKHYAERRRSRWWPAARVRKARRAWRAAHGLRLLGVPTARPRALIEYRGGLFGAIEAYLVLDFVDGANLADAFNEARVDAALTADLAATLRSWREAWFSHGDCWVGNFIVAGGQIYAIDLDAAVFHWFAHRFARRHRRALTRLLRGCPAAVREALTRELAAPETPLVARAAALGGPP